MKWSMRHHSSLSRAMSRLRRSIELMRVLDASEWHRWFAWYPVVLARDSGLGYWAWLEFIERKTSSSRSTGEWIRRYRPVQVPEVVTRKVKQPARRVPEGPKKDGPTRPR